MAETSKQPGRTRALNLYSLDAGHEARLVDMPGFGYARTSKETRSAFADLVNGYLQSRDCLSGLVMVLDIRRVADGGATPVRDAEMTVLEWISSTETPLHILLNKADKLRGPDEAAAALETLATLCAAQWGSADRMRGLVSAQTFSSKTREGVDVAEAAIFDMFADGGVDLSTRTRGAGREAPASSPRARRRPKAKKAKRGKQR